MKYIIDRIEDKFAIVELENGKLADIPREAVPPEAREGDIIAVNVDKAGTEKRRKEVRKLEDDVFVD